MIAALVVLASLLATPSSASPSPDTPKNCERCAGWNRPHPPVHVYGNTYWVGVDGLSVVAINTGAGVILLDGALPQSAPLVKASLAREGLQLSNVKLIASSHAHYDHAGGIAALQRDSGATVLGSARTVEALRAGSPTADDPLTGYGKASNAFAPVKGRLRVVADGEVIKLGDVELTAHYTPGHTPGATTWTWKSCQGQRCLDIVYGDSLNAVGPEDFHFTPLARSFHASIDKLGALPCDVLITVHPEYSETVAKLTAALDGGTADIALPGQCARYAANARRSLDERLAEEAKSQRKAP